MLIQPDSSKTAHPLFIHIIRRLSQLYFPRFYIVQLCSVYMMLPAASESDCQMFTNTPLPDTDTTGQQAAAHLRLIEVHDCEPDEPTICISIHVT